MSPFPLPILSPKGTIIVYIRDKKKKTNRFENNFLVTANLGDETVEIPILENKRIESKEEDKFGCSEGKNIGKAIMPLFAYNLIKNYEKKSNISDEEKKNAIELSIASGVFSKFTGYVGLSKNANIDAQSVNEKENDSSSENDSFSDSSSDNFSFSDSSSDNCRGKKAACKKAASSDSDDSDDNSVRGRSCCRGNARAKRMPHPTCNKKALKACSYKDDDESSSSDKEVLKEKRRIESSSSDEKEKPTIKKKMPSKTRLKPTMKKAESSSSDEEEMPTKKKKMPSKARLRPTIKKNESSSSDEEEMPPIKKKISRKTRLIPNMKKAKFSSSDDEEITKNAKKVKMETDNKKEETMKRKPKRKPFDLMSLLRLQNLHGFWEDLDEINAMLGSDISRIKGVDVTPKNLNTNCVATILAIAALHVKANDQKNIWTMIEKKAIKWLMKNLKGVDIDQLIKDTESLI